MVTDREKYAWRVVLTTDKGVTSEVEYSAYWDPDKVAPVDVARACAVEQFMASDRTVGLIGVSAELIG